MLNPFLTCFLAILAAIFFVWISPHFTRFIKGSKENDDDLDLFH